MVIPVPSFLIPVPSVETCGNVKSLSELVLYSHARTVANIGGLGVGGVWLYQFLRYVGRLNCIQYHLRL